jgi:hypothetical protein
MKNAAIEKKENIVEIYKESKRLGTCIIKLDREIFEEIQRRGYNITLYYNATGSRKTYPMLSFTEKGKTKLIRLNKYVMNNFKDNIYYKDKDSFNNTKENLVLKRTKLKLCSNTTEDKLNLLEFNNALEEIFKSIDKIKSTLEELDDKINYNEELIKQQREKREELSFWLKLYYMLRGNNA